MKRLWFYWGYLFLIWGLFRFLFRLPAVVEELWFKPVLWLTPLFWWNVSLALGGVTFWRGKWLGSLLWGMGAGAIYFLIIVLGGGQRPAFNLNGLGVALATAITEEMVFSGFVAEYLRKIRGDRWQNLLTLALMTASMRLPILFFVYGASWREVAGVVLFAGASGVINAWIRLRTDNTAGSILARLGINLAVLG